MVPCWPMEPQSQPQPMLTVKEVCRLTQLSRRTIARAIAGGELRALDLSTGHAGRPHWRIPRQALREWLDASTRKR
jgi:excisionase family DNA binding protein